MSDYTSKASIAGMREGYGEYAESQYNAIAAGIEHATSQLIEVLDLSPTSDFIHSVDLGAADGINSFPVIKSFSQALMKKREPLNLLVSHVDLPSADLNGLSYNIHEHERSYRQALTEENINIHSVIAPNSFYNSFLPNSSADILFSTTALHYASKRASKLSKHVHPLHAAGIEEISAWDKLSDSDLNTALTNINRCLKARWEILGGGAGS
jgi:hypothetical protein